MKFHLFEFYPLLHGGDFALRIPDFTPILQSVLLLHSLYSVHSLYSLHLLHLHHLLHLADEANDEANEASEANEAMNTLTKCV